MIWKSYCHSVLLWWTVSLFKVYSAACQCSWDRLHYLHDPENDDAGGEKELNYWPYFIFLKQAHSHTIKYTLRHSFNIHFTKTEHGHICIGRVPTWTHKNAPTHPHPLIFLKGMNNRKEKMVCGAVWHIAGTNLPAARGSAEWTQLRGWFGARAGAPWRQKDTAKELRQRNSLPHTNNTTHIHTYPPLLSHSCLSPSHQGKAGTRQGYATLGCQL